MGAGTWDSVGWLKERGQYVREGPSAGKSRKKLLQLFPEGQEGWGEGG